MARVRITELRRRIYLILEQGPVGDRTSVVVDRLLVAITPLLRHLTKKCWKPCCLI